MDKYPKLRENRTEKNRVLNTKDMAIKTFIVEGMTCKNCKSHVEKGINEISGIDDVIVDMSNGQVRVSGNEIDNLKVKLSIEEMGYVFKGEIHNVARSSDVWLS